MDHVRRPDIQKDIITVIFIHLHLDNKDLCSLQGTSKNVFIISYHLTLHEFSHQYKLRTLKRVFPRWHLHRSSAGIELLAPEEKVTELCHWS